MAVKHPELTDLTKKNIIEAFWQCLSKSALPALHVSTICRRAGYNRTTFYKYFLDILDLKNQAEDNLLSELMALISDAVKDQSDQEVMLTISRISLNFNSKLGLLFSSKGDPSFSLKYRTELEPIVRRSMDKKTDSRQIHLLCAYATDAIAATLEWLYTHPEENPDDALAFLHRFLSAGIEGIEQG